jgi:transcriptional repressor NrdR|tara:strand:- start:40 stop:315 length:276 start_codon:yes stop_codon:yes gene_type:complete
MALALRKRPVPADAIDTAVTQIEEKLAGHSEKEISTQRIGELVMGELRRIDKVAYVRFASVYRSFEDVSDFQDLLNEVRTKKIKKKIKGKR